MRKRIRAPLLLRVTRTPVTMQERGWLGVNTDTHSYYLGDRLYVDVIRNSQLCVSGSGTALSAANIDSSGWPTVIHTIILSGNNGNCAVGVHKMTITSRGGGPVTVTNFANCTVTLTGTVGDTRTYDITVSDHASSTAAVNVSAGIAEVICVRPGFAVDTTVKWNPDAVAYYKRFCIWRTMKAATVEANNTRTEWDSGTSTNRTTPVNCRAGYGLSQNGMPWEDIVDFSNTLYAASGSAFRTLWVDIPYLASSDYRTKLFTCLRDSLNPNIESLCSYANEVWNFAYAVYYYAQEQAVAQADAVFNNAPNYSQITSVTGDGTTVTVTLASALPAGWITGKHVNVNLASATFNGNDLAITATGANTFTYSKAVSGTATITNSQIVGLVASGINYDNVNNFVTFQVRWYYEKLRTIALEAEAVFGVLGGRIKIGAEWRQPLGVPDTAPDIKGVEYLRDVFTDRLPNAYLDWHAVAPYIQPTNTSDSVDACFTSIATQLTARLLDTVYHKEFCASFGFRALCYEGGLDTGNLTTPSQATLTSVYQDARVRTDVLTPLLKGLADRGIEEVAYFEASPFPIAPTFVSHRYFYMEDVVPQGTKSQKMLSLDDALTYTPATTPTVRNTAPGTVTILNYCSRDIHGFSGLAFTNSGATMGYNGSTAPSGAHWLEVVIYFGLAGSYTLNIPASLNAGASINLTVTFEPYGAGSQYTYPIAAASTGFGGTPAANGEMAITINRAGWKVMRIAVNTTRSFGLGDPVFTKV